tara:strand:- start:89 stop:607 length:519 start_codon:yes stop_codon:yes gene_type:complete
MKSVQVLDNFLPDDQFNSLQSVLMGEGFPWFYNENILREDRNDLFQFVHTLYDKRRGGAGPYLDLLEGCLHQLGAQDLYRIKANLNPRIESIRDTGYHIDIDIPDVKTSILYLNTNNGCTKFSNGKIDSVANRMVIFDAEIQHTGTTCTDEKTRVVINFNYLSKEGASVIEE